MFPAILLRNFQKHLTYFLQIGRLSLRILQGLERMYGQQDRTVQTPVSISRLVHQQNKLRCQLMLETEEVVLTLFLEVVLETPP